jgi:hypothetical protein
MGNLLIDLTGNKFGRLSVIKRVGNNRHNQVKWLCKCDCGKEVVVIGNNLKRGTTKSCGCIHISDLIGKKFGRLTVIKNVERPEKYKNTEAYWKCACDCGKVIIVSTSSLRSGNTKSCGCLRAELLGAMAKRVNRIGVGESAFNRIYYDYKRTAKRRNIEFDISEDYFKYLVQQNCYYCGIEPFRTISMKSKNGDFICNGIDRIDNSSGYIKGNVVSCCKNCNQSKNDKSVQEFMNWVDRLYNYSIRLRLYKVVI